jgi:putative oxidoreductase
MAFGLLLVRLTVGLVEAVHGAQKLFGWFGGAGPDGTGRLLSELGFPPGRRHAQVAGVVEVVGGLLLAAGLLTPLAATLVFSVMFVATVSVYVRRGFFAMTGGCEYALVLALAALALAFTGPGSLSLDALLGLTMSGPLWGAAAFLAGVAGGGAALTRRGAS